MRIERCFDVPKTTLFTYRSGLIPFLTTKDGILVGIVRSLNGEEWVFPKGHIDPSDLDDPRITAIREAQEEMGVRCVIIGSPIIHIFNDPKPGTFTNFKIICSLYPAVVEGSADQVDQRESEFLPIEEAYRKLSFPAHKIALITASESYELTLGQLHACLEVKGGAEVESTGSHDHPSE